VGDIDTVNELVDEIELVFIPLPVIVSVTVCNIVVDGVVVSVLVHVLNKVRVDVDVRALEEVRDEIREMDEVEVTELHTEVVLVFDEEVDEEYDGELVWDFELVVVFVDVVELVPLLVVDCDPENEHDPV
jgi:hypothetical protein